jgi:hypothetical protein
LKRQLSLFVVGKACLHKCPGSSTTEASRPLLLVYPFRSPHSLAGTDAEVAGHSIPSRLLLPHILGSPNNLFSERFTLRSHTCLNVRLHTRCRVTVPRTSAGWASISPQGSS